MPKQTKAIVPTAEQMLTDYSFSEAVETISKLDGRRREKLVAQIWTAYHRLCVKGA